MNADGPTGRNDHSALEQRRDAALDVVTRPNRNRGSISRRGLALLHRVEWMGGGAVFTAGIRVIDINGHHRPRLPHASAVRGDNQIVFFDHV